MGRWLGASAVWIRYTDVRFTSGLETSLELVTTLAHAEQSLAQARHDGKLATAQLILAEGGEQR